MFVYNVKINKSSVIKVALIAIALIGFLFMGITLLTAKNKVKDTITIPDLVNISSNNYTNVLKEVHDNLHTYTGQKIKFIGYVYRVSDIDKNEFILARDMVVNSSNETVVVGFLSKCNNANNFKNGTWVEISRNYQKRRVSWRNANN